MMSHVITSALLDQFREDGYAVLPGLYDEETMEVWRRLHRRLCEENARAEGMGSWWFGNMTERAPVEMLPAVANPSVLELLEAIMGPFVQLDNLTLAAFPPTENLDGKVSGWHRDRWAEVPRGPTFQRPLAANAISYLQDLDDAYGPLRVIPGSHRRPITIAPEDQQLPHPEERLVYAKAGDAVVTHNGLIHSGTPNTSGKVRYFFSVYYNLSWLRTTDDHSGPNVTRIVAEAKERGDHRMLRLFGVDEHLQQRGNSGFLQPDENRWAEWLAEDEAALVAS
jgi:ectoine hydroxylase-related dioxygenase (phytanoyl-CoA dioxygenase family)